MIQTIKKRLLSSPKINTAISWLYRFFMFNRVKGKRNNSLVFDKSYLMRCKINFNGFGNTIVFKGTTMFDHSSFTINGNNNTIVFKDLVVGHGLKVNIEDNHNTVIVGEKTLFAGAMEIACTEGSMVSIGDNCLFSAEIDIRTGDSHSVLDNMGARINPAANIEIGNHVWCGRRAMILKGSTVMDNSIIGAGTILTKKILENGVVIAGNPGRIVKKGVNWKHERI